MSDRFQPVLALFALAAHRYYDGSDSCLPSPRLTGLPAYLTTHSQRSASNHVMQPRYRFTRHIPAYRASFGLRHRIAGSSLHTAESSSLYCGPPVRLRLLSTPPHGDAVTFDYRALAYPDTDFHCANVAPSRAHNSPAWPENISLDQQKDRQHSGAALTSRHQ